MNANGEALTFYLVTVLAFVFFSISLNECPTD